MVAPASSLDSPKPASEDIRPEPAETLEAQIGLSRAGTFIPELESLRGIAVALVFAFHIDRIVMVVRSPPTSTPMSLVRAGHTGVDLFFLLSGFLLALPFIAEALGGKPASIRTYFARRVLRIVPLYWAALLVASVMMVRSASEFVHVLPYFVFLQSLDRAATVLFPYSTGWWSLATEAQFYLLLPLLPLVLRTRRRRLAAVVVLGLLIVAYIAMVTGYLRIRTVRGQMALMNSALARGPLFLWGIAAAFLYYRRGAAIRARLANVGWLRSGGADLLLVAVLVAMAVFLHAIYTMGPNRQISAGYQPWHIVNGGLWTAFLLLVLLFPLRTKPLFHNAFAARLGVLSYSVYLVHAPLLHYGFGAARSLIPSWGLLGWTAPTMVVVAALAAVCWGISSLTYRFIERPFLVRKARIA